MNGELRGVRGWLAFLAVSLFILRPLVLIFATLAGVSATESANPVLLTLAGWGTAKTITWVAVALQILCSGAAGWMLMIRFKPSTVTAVVALLWVGGPLLSLVCTAGVAAVLGVHLSDAIDPGELGKDLVYATVWTAYLKRSERVRNTYLEDPELETLSTTFG